MTSPPSGRTNGSFASSSANASGTSAVSGSTAADLIAALDAICLCSNPERSLRIVGNKGMPLTYVGSQAPRYSGYTTHVAGDLCGMADVIERFRKEATA